VVTAALRGLVPITLHAHGYGWFCEDGGSTLALHVPIVRGPAVDGLHAVVTAALVGVGAAVAGQTKAETWSPHLTLLADGLDPARLGAAAAWLGRRHHPRWQIPVDRVLLTGGRQDDHSGIEVPFGAAHG
jgi:hypothetical protein